ncbi:hypothetical protein TRIUR3_19522 [Triticum urartu]|uniref:Uncharacterized protein n=1 Tax=Triticum urartu TaxID=4572 RepID=M7ZCI3_TRIUA|nr:hypothetical protein TRIUR3_19522 [Triticum urartu]
MVVANLHCGRYIAYDLLHQCISHLIDADATVLEQNRAVDFELFKVWIVVWFQYNYNCTDIFVCIKSALYNVPDIMHFIDTLLELLSLVVHGF